MGLFDNILDVLNAVNAVSGSTKNSFDNLELVSKPISEDEVPEAFLEALRAGNVKTPSIFLDDDDDDFFINSENFKEDEDTEEDLQLKEYIKERNSYSMERFFRFEAYFCNYTIDNTDYKNGELIDILLDQYSSALLKLNGPIIYSDDMKTLTSGAVFHFYEPYCEDALDDDVDLAEHYNHFHRLLETDFFVEDDHKTIFITVDPENLEAFLKKYVTPVVIVDCNERLSDSDVLKMLNKNPTDIIKDKKIQPFFWINMSKIVLDIVKIVKSISSAIENCADEITKIVDYPPSITHMLGVRSSMYNDKEKVIEKIDEFWEKLNYLDGIETPLFKISTTLRDRDLDLDLGLDFLGINSDDDSD